MPVKLHYIMHFSHFDLCINTFVNVTSLLLLIFLLKYTGTSKSTTVRNIFLTRLHYCTVLSKFMELSLNERSPVTGGTRVLRYLDQINLAISNIQNGG